MKIESITDVAQRLIEAIDKYTNNDNHSEHVMIKNIVTELDELRLWIKDGILEKRTTN